LLKTTTGLTALAICLFAITASAETHSSLPVMSLNQPVDAQEVQADVPAFTTISLKNYNQPAPVVEPVARIPVPRPSRPAAMEALVDTDYGDQALIPEIGMKAVVSNSDVNRIACKSPIKDIIFSPEKGLKAQVSGNNVFVKFQAKVLGTETLYAQQPVDIYVVCGGNTYNIMLVPEGVTSQTIRLDSGKTERVQKNASLFEGQPFEKQIRTLINYGFIEDFPESFQVTDEKDVDIPAYKGLITSLRRTVRIEGEGLLLKEFTAISDKNRELTERMFLNPKFSKNPVAIGLEKLKVKKNEPIRVFVVERTTGGVL